MRGIFFHSTPGSFSWQGPSNWIPGVSIFVFLGTFSLDTKNHSWILTVLGLLETWFLYSSIYGVCWLQEDCFPTQDQFLQEGRLLGKKGVQRVYWGWWEDGLLSIWQFCKSTKLFPPNFFQPKIEQPRWWWLNSCPGKERKSSYSYKRKRGVTPNPWPQKILSNVRKLSLLSEACREVPSGASVQVNGCWVGHQHLG